jgi:dTDP-4-amino-4,6-dideoxygalactose transaminase
MKVRIFLSPPHMSGHEQDFIADAFESNYIAPLGPMVDAFEREFCRKAGMAHGVAVSSGTAAMHLAMDILGVGQGDEVFASTLTFVGSISPAIFRGATPVFIDSDRISWNMDPDLLAGELENCAGTGRLPKAVVPTDLYGQCADLDRILEICKPHGVPVIADAAEALGATYKGRSAGSEARAAVFSFNGNKIITTSGGGLLASDDESFVEKARFLSQQARDPAPYYQHSEIGYNYRMSNIVAAIGRGQLQVLDERVARKREIFNYYKEALAALPGIEFMPEAPYGVCTRWLTVILVTPEEFGVDGEAICLALEEENIESRPVWKPMHLQPVFEIVQGSKENSKLKTQNSQFAGRKYSARVVGGEVSEDLFRRGLCLPSGTQMTEEDLGRVVGVIKKMRGKGK